MTEEYKPIDCDYHDELEKLATLRQNARLTVRDESGGRRELEAVIADVYARDGVEYLRTESGEELRLDRIENVDGKLRAD